MTFQYTNFKILEVNGVDTKKFLQGLTTADLSGLSADNDILLTAFANLKGRIISLCFVKFITNEKLLLSVEQEVLDDLLAWLKKYGTFSKVAFSINDDYALFFTQTGFLNHDILAKDSLASKMTLEQVQKENIFNKLATINAANFEKFLPAELDLDNVDKVVCYTKGCYMGQEVIARMHYKAKLKKELAVFKSQSDITDFDLKDSQGKPLANVVNKVFVDNQCYMLVVFHKQAPEQQYHLDNGKIITKC
ncbi:MULTISPECIES: CAF17-like 4Fe-4S cluster assembly/insertion protein YgfZ [Francisella]|uniref:Amino acid transporter n=1 Tax=Francisella opportunistica TaxID=2016517 RepID=A0A345JRF8_9GAMM|nr:MULTISPECIES: amino acid transporter [Francisella]APC91631.1 Folate-dependent protein for Fe/S cluster synthesis/repair in oxidative stress [Francisella sp. MA067296]AXH29904.1 amino acid transporter [Francisella opportunistica]AXH31551.1 amino acid transporter [Francisella opportunistica]AXH33199.1 amino acid transporter [Francisella opportunistica]